MLALEVLHGRRIVAAPAALDAAQWPEGATILRFAPDDVFVLGVAHGDHGDAGDAGDVDVAGEHVIVADECGFVGCWLDAEARRVVSRHIEWPLPAERPALAQGYVAGVPAKLYLAESGETLLLCAAAYAVDLMERLS